MTDFGRFCPRCGKPTTSSDGKEDSCENNHIYDSDSAFKQEPIFQFVPNGKLTTKDIGELLCLLGFQVTMDNMLFQREQFHHLRKHFYLVNQEKKDG